MHLVLSFPAMPRYMGKSFGNGLLVAIDGEKRV
jgi:hypothetical protein